ncbi:hypothetical protein Bmyc01_42810 [Bacillus mycoides]|nr:hypothetical protein Bmyc01_42810 [Bacillus mycoides]
MIQKWFSTKRLISLVCECKAQRVLEHRLKNAMIPEEFTDARFDSYKRETEEQKLLYSTMGKYLQNFKEIKETK